MHFEDLSQKCFIYLFILFYLFIYLFYFIYLFIDKVKELKSQNQKSEMSTFRWSTWKHPWIINNFKIVNILIYDFKYYLNIFVNTKKQKLFFKWRSLKWMKWSPFKKHLYFNI